MEKTEQEQIFEEWINQHKALLFKVVKTYADNAEDQDDLFQEICIQVWKSIPNYRKESKVSTWMYKVALNTTMKWIKVETKRTFKEYDLQNVPILRYDYSVKQDTRIEWIYHQISRLSEVDRSISLLLLDGFSYKEMSDITGLTTSHIGVRINRIKKYLIEKSETYNHEF